MSLIIPILAEVADKEPSASYFGLSALLCMAVVGPMVWWKKWLAVIAVPLGALHAAVTLGEIWDPYVGPAIMQELGSSYIVIAYLAAAAPFVLIALLLFWRGRMREKDGVSIPSSSANI
jgi:hypothetical protein